MGKNNLETIYQKIKLNKSINLNSSQEKALKKLLEIHDSHFEQSNFFSKILKKPAKIKKGIYLYGAVGRGKSTILNIFFDHLTQKRKCKFHFHDFLEMIHAQMKQIRDGKSAIDPLKIIAEKIAAENDILCLDELHLTDIGNAMIMGRLFKFLFNFNILIVITSNRHPKNLYQGGLQAEYFQNFAELLEKHLEIHEIEAEMDYRALKGKSDFRVKFEILENAIINEMALQLTKGKLEPQKIPHGSHEIFCPLASENLAIFDFEDLCERNYSTKDYKFLCQKFKIIILKNIRQLKQEDRDEAVRFTNFVDSAYENGIILIFSTAVPLAEIYVKGKGSFEFERTVSRLLEMSSGEYLAARMY